MRVIQKFDVISSMQNAYVEKLIKKYEISINQKTSLILLFYQSLILYIKKVDSDKIHVYKRHETFIKMINNLQFHIS